MEPIVKTQNNTDPYKPVAARKKQNDIKIQR